jgi:hypothetical protein
MLVLFCFFENCCSPCRAPLRSWRSIEKQFKWSLQYCSALAVRRAGILKNRIRSDFTIYFNIDEFKPYTFSRIARVPRVSARLFR